MPLPQHAPICTLCIDGVGARSCFHGINHLLFNYYYYYYYYFPIWAVNPGEMLCLGSGGLRWQRESRAFPRGEALDRESSGNLLANLVCLFCFFPLGCVIGNVHGIKTPTAGTAGGAKRTMGRGGVTLHPHPCVPPPRVGAGGSVGKATSARRRRVPFHHSRISLAARGDAKACFLSGGWLWVLLPRSSDVPWSGWILAWVRASAALGLHSKLPIKTQ